MEKLLVATRNKGKEQQGTDRFLLFMILKPATFTFVQELAKV